MTGSDDWDAEAAEGYDGTIEMTRLGKATATTRCSAAPKKRHINPQLSRVPADV